MAKAYRLPFDYVLHGMSYANLILYGAVLPSPGAGKDKKGRAGRRSADIPLKADDPKNRDRVNRIIDSFT